MMIVGFPVGLLQFSLLSPFSRRSVLRTAQAIQQCGSTESNWLGPDRESREFYDKLNLWNTAHWQGMKEQQNYVLQTLDELWLSRQRYHSSSWIFVHIDYTRTRTLKLCFVSPNKIRISPFRSHSLLDCLNYFLLIARSSEVDVVSRGCPSDVSSSPLFVRFSIVCFNNSFINVGMKFAR